MDQDTVIRTYIRNFDFRPLFNELGWDNFGAANEWGISNTRHYEIDGAAYTLAPVAQKRGFQVYECAPADGKIPPLSTRQKIDRKLTETAREHLIIFVGRDPKMQHWQWTHREKGQPLVARGETYYAGQSPDLLVQKLLRLRFSLDQEENLGILDVTRAAKQAFDTEKVTKRFYAQFASEHKAFLAFIGGIGAQSDREWYTSLMLNRLMFVYFIQSKGFLDGDENYLRHRLARMQAEHGRDQFYSFYRTFLLRLFHDGLATPEHDRTPDVEALLGDIPYLNGGLFELHEIERKYPLIEIPDAAFEAIFRFFKEWDWHLDTRPNATGREINPDVLGYIFEKFINQKQMGAYYTKEDITEYIGKNTIIPFLFDAAKRDCENAFRPGGEVWRLLAENPDFYIYKAVRQGTDLPLPDKIAAGIMEVSRRGGWNRPAPPEYALPTETWREYVARRQRYESLRAKLASGTVTEINDLITDNLDIRAFAQDVLIFCEGANLLEAFYDAITRVTVLDPTCGSGAFLFAALNILAPLYEACLEGMRRFVDEADRLGHPERYPQFRTVLKEIEAHPNQDYFITKKIITNNLYGVDIMEEAVETCKLRLFLQLASLLEPGQKIEPLPDIDFNVRAGNTLVGYTSEAAVRAAAAARLNIYGDVDRIINQAKVVDTLMSRFREGQTAGNELARLQKSALHGELAKLAADLDRYLAAEYGIVEQDDPEGYADRFAAWRASHQPFHWYSEFYGIMHRGGFDVIIGNPPYVARSEINYAIRNYATMPCGDIYAQCVERSIASLLVSDGRFSMIIPISSVSTDGYSSLRDIFEESDREFFAANFAERPSKLFDEVDKRLTILTATNKMATFSVHTTGYRRWVADERSVLFATIRYTQVAPNYLSMSGFPKIGTAYEAQVLRKLRDQSRSVQYFCRKRSAFAVRFTRKLRYFIQFFLEPPRIFNAAGELLLPTELKEIYLTSQGNRDALVSTLNSGLFFWFFVTFSDCRNVNLREILNFPIDLDSLRPTVATRLAALSSELLEDSRTHAIFQSRNDKRSGRLKIESFQPRLSKPIIDEIDRVLAKHYGFTDEELDFIINYDIKYRMGQGAAEDDA